MSAHAILAPSSAPVWGVCAGSVRAALAFPNWTTPEAEIGTAAHWVCAEVLLAYKRPDGGCPSTYDWVGKRAPNGLIVDEEMAEGADVFVKDVLDVAQEFGGLQAIEVEMRVYMPEIHPENWGTLDALIWLADKGRLYLWDYKHGHLGVPARANLQLIDYTKGVMNFLQIDGLQEQHITVHHRIVQPFAFKPSGAVEEWIVNAADLRGYYNQLNAKAYEALGMSPTLTPGAHCRNCPALVSCRGATLATAALADYAATPYAMDTRTPDQLGVEYRILDEALTLLKARVKAIAEQIQSNPTGSGYVIQGKMGRKQWKVSPDIAIAILASAGVDITKPAAKTPAQAAKGIKDANILAVIDSISNRPSRGVALTKAEDSNVFKAFNRIK